MSTRAREGSALMLALMTVVVLSSLMAAFLFRMHLEGDLAARQRFGRKASELARAGQEYGKYLLIKSRRAGNEPEDEMTEEFFMAIRHLQRGLELTNFPVAMAEGTIALTISPEYARRNVNRLSDLDWEKLLEISGLPARHHAALIAAFRDWTDADESTRLLGAESDDPWYLELGLPVKNGPVEFLTELALIRGFTPALLYGGSLREYYDEPETRVSGILPLLTVYGDGKVNLNTAPREVLLTLSGLREEQVDWILEGRAGPDEIPGTLDDGYTNVAQALATAGLDGRNAVLFNTADVRWVRVRAVGEVGGIRRVSQAVYEFQGNNFTLLDYEEGGRD